MGYLRESWLSALLAPKSILCRRLLPIVSSSPRDLITSPAYVVLSAADELKDKTTRPNQLWRTDFTYLKVIVLGLVLPQHDPG